MNHPKYKNKYTNLEVEIIDPISCGMCDRTLGRTLVIYKSKDEDFHRVMDHLEFYNDYKQIK